MAELMQHKTDTNAHGNETCWNQSQWKTLLTCEQLAITSDDSSMKSVEHNLYHDLVGTRTILSLHSLFAIANVVTANAGKYSAAEVR